MGKTALSYIENTLFKQLGFKKEEDYKKFVSHTMNKEEYEKILYYAGVDPRTGEMKDKATLSNAIIKMHNKLAEKAQNYIRSSGLYEDGGDAEGYMGEIPGMGDSAGFPKEPAGMKEIGPEATADTLPASYIEDPDETKIKKNKKKDKKNKMKNLKGYVEFLGGDTPKINPN